MNMMNIKNLFADIIAALKKPKLSIDLGLKAAEANHPFYLNVVNDFYQSARKPHPKFPLIKSLQYGVALLPMPSSYDKYLKTLASSARGSINKAKKNNYQFQRINYNDHLKEISDIHRSTSIRQGKMPQEFLSQKLKAINDPQSVDDRHDYPYFGILKDGHLVAYAGCLVAGEMLLLSTIFGHDKYKSYGIVPYLIACIADYKYKNYPHVKYYIYDKYYGASISLRFFKRKLRFEPHTVTWQL
jgi:hypothetical protein